MVYLAFLPPSPRPDVSELVTEYVIPPMVIEVVVKLTTPLPELLALNIPVKVAEKLSLPAIGTVWVMVSVDLYVRTSPLIERRISHGYGTRFIG